MRSGFRVLVQAIAFSLVAWSSSRAGSPPNSLVGLWESRETSQGGIGHAFEFRPDGTFVEVTVVMVEMPYRVSGNQLVVGKEPDSNSTTFRFDGDALVSTEADGSVVRRERPTGKTGAPSSILGDWRYCHYVNQIAYERYSEAGRMILRLPMISSTGRYALAGDVLTLEKPGQPETRLKAVVQGDELVVTGATPGPAPYRREPTGAWYEPGKIEKCTSTNPLTAALTATPVSTDASVLPHVRSHPPIESFVGIWRNVDPQSGKWTRVEIQAKADTLRVRIWGKCHPSDCDLGWATAKYKGSPIVLSQDVGFVKSRFTLSLEGDVLRMTTADHFTDRSGRPDKVYDSRFRK